MIYVNTFASICTSNEAAHTFIVNYSSTNQFIVSLRCWNFIILFIVLTFDEQEQYDVSY